MCVSVCLCLHPSHSNRIEYVKYERDENNKYNTKKMEKERNVACWIDGNGRLLNHLHFKLDLCRSCFAHSQKCAPLSLSFFWRYLYLFSLAHKHRQIDKWIELNWVKKKRQKTSERRVKCVELCVLFVSETTLETLMVIFLPVVYLLFCFVLFCFSFFLSLIESNRARHVHCTGILLLLMCVCAKILRKLQQTFSTLLTYI